MLERVAWIFDTVLLFDISSSDVRDDGDKNDTAEEVERFKKVLFATPCDGGAGICALSDSDFSYFCWLQRGRGDGDGRVDESLGEVDWIFRRNTSEYGNSLFVHGGCSRVVEMVCK